MFIPKVNMVRKSAWHKDPEEEWLSKDDSQVWQQHCIVAAMFVTGAQCICYMQQYAANQLPSSHHALHMATISTVTGDAMCANHVLCARVPQVYIHAGQVMTGSLCKKTLGPTPGGLVHAIWMEHGHDATRKCVLSGHSSRCLIS